MPFFAYALSAISQNIRYIGYPKSFWNNLVTDTPITRLSLLHILIGHNAMLKFLFNVYNKIQAYLSKSSKTTDTGCLTHDREAPRSPTFHILKFTNSGKWSDISLFLSS